MKQSLGKAMWTVGLIKPDLRCFGKKRVHTEYHLSDYLRQRLLKCLLGIVTRASHMHVSTKLITAGRRAAVLDVVAWNFPEKRG